MTNPMPISGLILTLQDPTGVERLVQELLGQQSCLEVGVLQGNHLPAVLETTTPHESRQVHEWLLERPGIVSVDVVFVSTEEPVG